MTSDAKIWVELASKLGISIVAPFGLEVAGSRVQFSALLPQFGARLGMVVDADCDLLWLHRGNLIDAGYGYSCVELDGSADLSSAQEILSDWGWSGTLQKPDWLRA